MSEEPKPKPKITIDGRSFEFEPGDTIMRAAERVGVDAAIPRFCYHSGLPVAGTCRMCTVEVEKAPKLMTSCSTPAADGMIVHTQSEKVRKSRAGVMEFLLINHPLDCPVCDQAGECSLQEYNYEYGPGTSRFQEDKRVFKEATTKPLSDKLTLNMNRCIHCERCVRFTENISKTNELLMVNRGWMKELVTAQELGMFNDYQGNIADICPVGAITFNDFRFKKRVWFLKEKPTVCDGCARGCAIYADEEHNVIHRYRARRNDEVNGHWICDDGRVSFKVFMATDRVVQPLLKAGNTPDLQATTWDTALGAVSAKLKQAKRILVVLGTDATQEEAKSFLEKLPKLTKAEIRFHSWNGTGGGIQCSQDDGPYDEVLRRKDQTPNTRGLEELKIQPYDPSSKSAFDLAILFRAGRADIPPKTQATEEIAWGVWHRAGLDERFSAVLPGLGMPEKSGTYLNFQGLSQAFLPAVETLGESASVDRIFLSLVMLRLPKDAAATIADNQGEALVGYL